MNQRRKGRKLAGVLTTVCVTATLVGAVISPGITTTEVDLNDGGVWVTNSNTRLVGHLNYPSRSLDSGFRAASDSFDVAQNGEEVFVSDTASSTLSSVDVAHSTLGNPTDLEGYSTVVNGGTVAVINGEEGKVWTLPTSDYVSFDPETADPVVDDAPEAVVAVGLDGSVHVASAATAEVTSILPKGSTRDISTMDLEGVTEKDSLQVAAVGSKPVVLARESATLFLPEGHTQVLQGDLSLQESGTASDSVLLASDDELIAVPLSGGKTSTTASKAAGGHPSRPVMHRGCAYGAWAVTGAFIRDCDGEGNDVSLTTDSLKTAEQAVFRTNRDVIVLNDVESGTLWLPDEQMFMIDDWDQINSEVESEDTSDD